MPVTKGALVAERLGKRLATHQIASFGEYFRLLISGKNPDEVQIAIDLLTTNETYFFRETKHFDFLREQALAARNRNQLFRVWSAASSTGEEAYSIAMVLADCMESTPWEVIGSDISARVLQYAVRALYPMERARYLPPAYLSRFCLKGADEHEGHLLINSKLRSQVIFKPVNLNTTLPALGQFDLVFLRNVMIYFNSDTKREVVARVTTTIKRGGHCFVGHSESLNNITNSLNSIAPAIYQKPV